MENTNKRCFVNGAVLLLMLLTLGSGLVSAANDQTRAPSISKATYHQVNIPSQNAAEALNQLAEQTKALFMFPYDTAKSRQAHAVSGRYTIMEALDIILQGSGLAADLSQKGVIEIYHSDKAFNKNDGRKVMNNRKKVLAATIGFFAGAGMVPGVLGQEAASLSKAEAGWLDEVVVTANKREQSLQDTAMSISALGGEEIERKSLVNMRDYLSFVPNTSLIEVGSGWSQIVIRGIGVSLLEQSTVSTYFGEVPLTNSSRFGLSTDMKLVDIERVEVLRGPQGTLYGSGALGGTVRNIPVAANLSEMEGKLDIGYSATSGADDNSNKVVGVFNLPIIDEELALRTSVYRFDRAGYIDLVNTDARQDLADATGTSIAIEDDTGGHTYTGGRANLLWQANDRLSLSLLYATQEIEEDGQPDLNLDLGGYKFSRLSLAGTGVSEFRNDEFDFVNLVLKYDLGWGELHASSTQHDGETDEALTSDRWVPFYASYITSNKAKDGEVHEIRLSSQLDGPVQFVSGLYYEDFSFTQKQSENWFGDQASFDDADLGDDLTFFRAVRNSELTQRAVFGELIYTIDPQWELTFGGRWFDYDRRDSDIINGNETDVPIEEDGTTFKANVSWSPNEESLVYAQWSQGFRLGEGQGLPPASLCDVDEDGILDGTNGKLVPFVESDNTTNYELGGKFSFLDQRLVVNASLYRVDWEEIPVTVVSPQGSGCNKAIKNNSGEARSQGLELEARYSVTPELQVSLSAGYADTEFLDNGIANKGDRLPLTPEWNSTLGLEYRLDVAGYDAFIRSDYSYRDSFYVNAGGIDAETSNVDGYGKWDMRAGIALDQINIELYGTNLSNSDAVTSRWGFGTSLGYRMQPRTLGAQVSYKF